MSISLTVDDKAISAMTKDFEEEALILFEKAVIQAYLDLREATPVDTGRAKDGWKRTRPLSVDDVAYITNKVPYIGVLNDGHSKQAPQYFVEQTLLRLGFTLA